MPKFFSSGATDQALAYITDRATHLTLCAGAPATAAEAITKVGNGGAMLADLQVTPSVSSSFAVTTSASGERVLVVGSQSEILGHEAGLAEHLVLVDTSGGEILLLTELTEAQPVQPGVIIATRPFTVSLGTP